MSTFRKPRPSRLPPPPAPDDILGNLQQPEHAPAAPVSPSEEPPKKPDGRRLRHTGRTEQFATRVTKAWRDKLHRLATRTRRLYVDILEEALDDLDKKLSSR